MSASSVVSAVSEVVQQGAGEYTGCEMYVWMMDGQMGVRMSGFE
ncbi:hypothetical protein [Paenibacillus sp. FSL M7-0420]